MSVTAQEAKLRFIENGHHRFQEIYYNDYVGEERITPMVITPVAGCFVSIAQIDLYADDAGVSVLASCPGVVTARVAFRQVDAAGNVVQSQYWPLFVGAPGQPVTLAHDLTDLGQPGLVEIRVSYWEL